MPQLMNSHIHRVGIIAYPSMDKTAAIKVYRICLVHPYCGVQASEIRYGDIRRVSIGSLSPYNMELGNSVVWARTLPRILSLCHQALEDIILVAFRHKYSRERPTLKIFFGTVYASTRLSLHTGHARDPRK